MEISDRLEKYVPMVSFLSKVLGSDTEIILYDLVNKTVYYSENPVDENHKANKKMDGIEGKILESEQFASQQYVVNYRSITQNGEKVRGSTYFIRDDKNACIGMITINIRVTKYIEIREIVEKLIKGEEAMPLKDETPLLESIDYNFEDMMLSTIQAEVNKLGIPADRLTTEEKLEVIAELDKKGTFLIKGSIQEVAKAVNCSEVTIYRYLQSIK